MTRYTDDSKERVRDAVDMVDLVGTRTELRRAGANRYEALCPFHEERTPSFGIDPAQKLFYCFGCSEGGDAFRYVQMTEGLDFKGSLEYLADRYGVRLEPGEGGAGAGRGGRGDGRAPPLARAAARAARADRGVLRALPVGLRRGGARAGVSRFASPRRGGAAGVPRRLRAVGLRHAAAGRSAWRILEPGGVRRGAPRGVE